MEVAQEKGTGVEKRLRAALSAYIAAWDLGSMTRAVFYPVVRDALRGNYISIRRRNGTGNLVEVYIETDCGHILLAAQAASDELLQRTERIARNKAMRPWLRPENIGQDLREISCESVRKTLPGAMSAGRYAEYGIVFFTGWP